MTQAQSSMGTTLRRNGVEIAEVVSISGPSFTAETIDATHLKSPDWWREHIGSIKDGGEMTFETQSLVSDPTHNAATGVLSALAGSQAPPKDTWTMVFPDPQSTTWTLPAILTKYESNGAAINGKIGAKVTVKIAGKPTLA
jgi:hypothetical protein